MKPFTSIHAPADLHLIPGLIGGVASAVAAASQNMALPFPYATFSQASLADNFPMWGARTGLQQGALQLAGTVVSLCFGILSGILTGKLMTLSIFEPKTRLFYDDGGEWELVRKEKEWMLVTLGHVRMVCWNDMR